MVAVGTDLLVALFVVGFFAAAVVAVAFGTNRTVRRSYLAGFFTVFVVVNLFVSAIPAPVVHWHKFSHVRPESQTHYEFRVVDASGTELAYDAEATLGTDTVSMSKLHHLIRTEFSHEKNTEVAAHLFERATEYRDGVERRPLARFLRFPPHSTTGTWTTADLGEYDEFVELRLYRLDVETSADGRTATIADETRVLTYDARADELVVDAPSEIHYAANDRATDVAAARGARSQTTAVRSVAEGLP